MTIEEKHKKYYEWLNRINEDIIDPELPIIDPHHHLWTKKHPFAGSFPYLLEDLKKDTSSGHNILGTIFMECGQGYYPDGEERFKPVGETEYVAGVAKTSKNLKNYPSILGIIGYADMMLGAEVGEVLKTHIGVGDGLFRGIRHAAGWDESDMIDNSHSNPEKNIYFNTNFRRGIEELIDLNLTFDAWHYHHQILDLKELATNYPELTIIHDHFGGPLGIGPYEAKRDEIYKKWKDDISSLASCKNVYSKLGGLAMPINGWNWHKKNKPATSDEIVNANQSYYLHTIESFGFNRCMFESNFPVDKRSVSYHVLWNAFKKMTSRFDSGDRAKLFSETAKKVYKV